MNQRYLLARFLILQIVLSRFSHVQLFVTPWTVAGQAPLSMGFSRQEWWIGLPFPSPKDLPDAGIKPEPLTSPASAGGFFTTSASWEALLTRLVCQLLMSSSLQPHGLQPTKLLCLWGFPGKNTGEDSYSLLQGIFLTQRSIPGLLALQEDSLPSVKSLLVHSSTECPSWMVFYPMLPLSYQSIYHNTLKSPVCMFHQPVTPVNAYCLAPSFSHPQ